MEDEPEIDEKLITVLILLNAPGALHFATRG